MGRPQTPKADSPYPPGWEPFLAAIKAEMFDDTRRLVFADWLDENGDPERAELIRLQCRLWGMQHDDPEVQDACARCEALVTANWPRWTAGFPRCALRDTPPHFVRGFISMASLTGAQLLKHGADLVRLTPINDLNLSHVTPESLRSPVLAEVGGLYLAIVDSARVEALAAHPNLSNLRRLFVSNGFNDRTYRPTVRLSRAAVRALIANPSLSGLQQFEVNGTKHGDAVALGIAAGSFTRLEDLSLYHSNVSADGLKALVNSASAPTLTNLHLAGNHFGDTGIHHLVEAPALTHVECMNLIGCGLTAESARLLAEWPGLRTVRWLQIGANGLTEADADRIRNSPFAVALKDLSARP
jgi:uncharacterized protein (TIGR02996 family)